MKIDLHNHTTRCNHATGSIDAYMRYAIDQEIKVYGFSEHAPMDFDEGYRLGFQEMEAYQNDILTAREKYEKEIDIRLGYEVDWLPGHMDERVLDAEVDYLIGSVHFINKWGFDNPEFIGGWEERDVDEIWQAYFEAVTEMVKSDLFDIVGHLDLIKVFKYLPKKEIILLAKEALLAIKDADMVLEINAAGLRKPIAEIYPSIPLIEEAYALNIPITFGSDAHAPDQVGAGLQEAYALAQSAGYTQAATFRCRQREMINF